MGLSKKKVLQKQHETKLMELYKSYYDKALNGEVSCFKPFIDVSKELFVDAEDNELVKILKDIKVEDE